MADPADEYALRVVRHGLRGEPTGGRTFDFDDQTWVDVLHWIQGHRLVGLARRAATDGYVRISVAQLNDLDELHARRATRRREVGDSAVEASRLLTSHSIDHRFFKGFALSATFDPDGARDYDDADVLTGEADFDRAVALLETDGFRLLRPSPDRPLPSYVRSINLLRADRGNVDLHRRLVRSPFGERISDLPFARQSSWLQIGDVALPALGPEESGAIACLEVALADRPVKLRAIRDCVELSTDPSPVLEVADRWQVAGMTAVGMTMAYRALGIPPPIEATTTPISRRDHRLYQSFEAQAWLPYVALSLLDLRSNRERLSMLSEIGSSLSTISERGGWRQAARRQLSNLRGGSHSAD